MSSNASGEAVPQSHYLPRSRAGWWSVGLFLVLFASTQPPVVFMLANRIEPLVLGAPFLFAYLLSAYAAMIGVLIWARRRRL